MEFPFTYRKWDSDRLVHSLEDNKPLCFSKGQIFSPIHDRFFVLNERNSSVATFNSHWLLHNVSDASGRFLTMCEMKTEEGKESFRDVFVKIAPLVDPVKYLVGKCTGDLDVCRALPVWNKPDASYPTSRDVNNIPYVDAFFTYLSSQLLHHHAFLNGLDYYGSVLGRQASFEYDAIDDIELLEEAEYFSANHGSLFTMDKEARTKFLCHSARLRPALDIGEEASIDELTFVDVEEIDEISVLQPGSPVEEGLSVVDLSPLEDENAQREQTKLELLSDDESSGYCSSRSSDTGDESSVLDSDEEREEGSSGSEDEFDEDASALVTINDFPVQFSFLEKCERTVDELMNDEDNDLSEEEWESLILQLLLSLITYQKCFRLTHNDLHTNNVMYVKTEKPFLYYKWNGKHYKVPTYGRIYKIIDFGRAIYRFRGNTVCSNSFAPDGEAAGQYNCEPFLDEEKPRLDPNFSFDLCRFSTSLYDCLVDEEEDEDWWPIIKLVLGWCRDDKGRNVLYKSNGEERYPNFKLYKMIVRTVHSHVPKEVITNPLFDKYIIGKKHINKSQRIMNIDSLPDYA